jgi:GT2 family glycosyltransferase
MKPLVVIIVLNWNGLQDTMECLRSLESLEYENYHVMVVDNASSDGSVDVIRREFPSVELIANEANLGFAGGNNVGIKKALEGGAGYVLLLNNDTIVEPDFLAGMVDVAESDDSIGMVGPKICYFADPSKIWAIGGSVNMYTGRIGNMNDKADQSLFHGTVYVNYVTGCALLARSEVVKKIGVLDEDYFLYFEDTDWNMRARNAGYRAVIDCDVRILHKSGMAVQKIKGSNYYYMARNIPLFVSRNGRLRQKIVFFPLFFLRYGAAYLLHLIDGNKDKSRYIFMGLRDFIGKRYGRLK